MRWGRGIVVVAESWLLFTYTSLPFPRAAMAINHAPATATSRMRGRSPQVTWRGRRCRPPLRHHSTVSRKRIPAGRTERPTVATIYVSPLVVFATPASDPLLSSTTSIDQRRRHRHQPPPQLPRPSNDHDFAAEMRPYRHVCQLVPLSNLPNENQRKPHQQHHYYQHPQPPSRRLRTLLPVPFLFVVFMQLSSRMVESFSPRRPRPAPGPSTITTLAPPPAAATTTRAWPHRQWTSRGRPPGLAAKRQKRDQAKHEADYLNRWYDAVDANASPENVFWEEMERQRLLNEIGTSGTTSTSGGSSSSSSGGNGSVDRSLDRSDASFFAMGLSSIVNSGNPEMANSYPNGGGGTYRREGITNRSSSSSLPLSTLTRANQAATLSSLRGAGPGGSAMSSATAAALWGQSVPLVSPTAVEATLAEYAAFVVHDNWLDEELQWIMNEDESSMNDDRDAPLIDEQLRAWEKEDPEDRDGSDEDGDDEHGDSDDEMESNAWMQSEEPWDHWSAERNPNADYGNGLYPTPPITILNKKAAASEFLFLETDDDGGHDADDDGDSGETDAMDLAHERAQFEERLSRLQLSSRRLERARKSLNAKEFFAREPNRVEGSDRLWVAAIDNACFKNLVGVYRNYGIEFADNFGDWQDGCLDDALSFSIEDVASFKARKVFDATGLPCIASRTSFEIEPIPTKLNSGSGAPGSARTPMVNPRVASGYRFNDVGMHVDYLCDALRPVSEPHRVTRFKTCLCYYDGEMEIYGYGECDVDLLFANSLRTFIPVSQAINEMIKTLELSLGLEYQSWLTARAEASKANALSPASIKLRDRVLKDGRVLPNDIIDVSEFMDSQVDVNLMDECARDLAERFVDVKPTKILTVATTGLVIALPMAKYLQVPCVYARKERNIVMADTYKAGYSSKTVGKNRELLVSCSHIHANDRILIVDDFLSSGASQEALLRIIAEAGATPVGVGVLLEKEYDSGRQSLSGFDIPIHSLCRVTSVKNGVIQLHEEEGYERMR